MSTAHMPRLLCRLSDAFLQDDRLSATAVLVFMLSPASIHHSMAYTEALFTAASWLGLYCLYCRGSSCTAALAFALSSATRSNGKLAAAVLLPVSCVSCAMGATDCVHTACTYLWARLALQLLAATYLRGMEGMHWCSSADMALAHRCCF
jgi:Gpi18-like mannosyltransferase